MELTINHFPVDMVEESNENRLENGTLQFDTRELRDYILREDNRLQSVKIDIVYPGESCRIINILDILEPRAKAGENPDPFPGILGAPSSCGSGITNALKGIGVITCGPMEGAEDAILDMQGPCSNLSLFSHLLNIVITLCPHNQLSKGDFAEAAVQAGARAAVFLGKIANSSNSYENSEKLAICRLSPNTSHKKILPKICYVYPLYSQGDARDMLFYGRNTRDLIPTVIHPNVVFDGAVFWSGFSRPTKNTTYDHLNHGILRTLYASHGKSIDFIGTIIANHPKQYSEKILHAEMIANISKNILRADGAIITKDSGGQADTDVMKICENCENLGVKTTLATMEFAGNKGSSKGALVDASPQADAIVSLGNCAEPIELPVMERLIGGTYLKNQDCVPTGSINVPFNRIPGAIGMLGANRLTAIEV